MNFKIITYQIIPLLCAQFLLCSCEKPDEFHASGTFETEETLVSSEISGKLIKFEVEEGYQLQKDALVGKVDSIQYELQVKNLQAQIEALRNRTPEVALQLAALEERLNKQVYERNRTQTLIAENSETKKRLDDIVSEIKYLEGSIAASKSTLEKEAASIASAIKAMEAQVAQAQDNISKSKIHNPIDGTVIVKYAQQGEVISFGKPLYKIGNLQNLRLRAYFSAADVTRLKLGQKLKILADFGANEVREYEGTLIWISDKSEFTPKGICTRDERADLVYATKIEVKNDGYLKIGQYAEVIIPNDN